MGDVLFAYPKNQQCRYQQIDYTEIRTVISMVNKTGHARFRRAPVQPELTSHPQPPTLNLLSGSPEPAAADQHLMSVDTTKPGAAAIGGCVKDMDKEWFSLSNSVNSSSTFVSSVTGDGSVSDGKDGGTAFRLPPVSGKRCRENNHNRSVKTAGSSVCHCKKKKSQVKRTIRVPAISSKIADIPADEYSWRKYGQKPIKGSPYPRGYYKCSIVRGCPAKKHVERANDDPTVLIVTYSGEHLHAAHENTASGVDPSHLIVVESAT